MGFRQAATSIGIAGLTILTGFLCELAWWKAYFVYLLVIPILILTRPHAAEGRPGQETGGEKGLGLAGLKRVFTPGMVYWSVLSFFLGCFSFAYYLNVGMSITAKGLGGASVIGLATAWGSLLTIVIAVGFGVVLKAFGKFTMAVGLLLFAVSYFIIFGASSLLMVDRRRNCLRYGHRDPDAGGDALFDGNRGQGIQHHGAGRFKCLHQPRDRAVPRRSSMGLPRCSAPSTAQRACSPPPSGTLPCLPLKSSMSSCPGKKPAGGAGAGVSAQG